MATSTTPKYDVFNVSTGEATKVALTAEEIADRETQAAESAAQLAALQAKATARASAIAKLAELGLTEEEIAAL
jgi:DNA-binding NarL/FixJ family response regulator